MKTVGVATVSALATVVAASRGSFVESQAHASRKQRGRRGYQNWIFIAVITAVAGGQWPGVNWPGGLINPSVH
jgi:hypothetical protein